MRRNKKEQISFSEFVRQMEALWKTPGDDIEEKEMDDQKEKGDDRRPS